MLPRDNLLVKGIKYLPPQGTNGNDWHLKKKSGYNDEKIDDVGIAGVEVIPEKLKAEIMLQAKEIGENFKYLRIYEERRKMKKSLGVVENTTLLV